MSVGVHWNCIITQKFFSALSMRRFVDPCERERGECEWNVGQRARNSENEPQRTVWTSASSLKLWLTKCDRNSLRKLLRTGSRVSRPALNLFSFVSMTKPTHIEFIHTPLALCSVRLHIRPRHHKVSVVVCSSSSIHIFFFFFHYSFPSSTRALSVSPFVTWNIFFSSSTRELI